MRLGDQDGSILTQILDESSWSWLPLAIKQKHCGEGTGERNLPTLGSNQIPFSRLSISM